MQKLLQKFARRETKIYWKKQSTLFDFKWIPISFRFDETMDYNRFLYDFVVGGQHGNRLFCYNFRPKKSIIIVFFSLFLDEGGLLSNFMQLFKCTDFMDSILTNV